MKKVVIAFLLVLGGLVTYSIVDSVKNRPATGVVKTNDPKINDQGGVTGTTVPTMTTTTTIEPMPIPDPEPKPDPQPTVFVAKTFKKSLKRFAKEHKLKVVNAPRHIAKIFKTKKVVYDGTDIYLIGGDGNRYVIHKGKKIKLN